MPELIEAYWPYLLIALAIGIAVGWFIFVANRSDSSSMARISGLSSSGRWIWDALSGDPVDLGCLHLEAQQVRMLRVRAAADRGEPQGGSR